MYRAERHPRRHPRKIVERRRAFPPHTNRFSFLRVLYFIRQVPILPRIRRRRLAFAAGAVRAGPTQPLGLRMSAPSRSSRRSGPRHGLA